MLRYTHGRKPKMVGVAAHIASRAGAALARHAFKKYGKKAAYATLAAGTAYGGYKAFIKGGKGPKPKTRRIFTAGQSPDNQRQYVSSKEGSKIAPSALVDKTVMSSMQRQIFYWRQYAVEATGAAFNMGLDHSGTTSRFLPIYLFDLTARPQYVRGAVIPALCGYRAFMPTSGVEDGKVKWTSVQGLDANANSSVFIQTDESTNLANSQSRGTSMLQWLDIRAQIQGTRTVPTKVTFELIRLLDDELDPQPTPQTVQNGVTSIAHQVYWQSEASALTVNPIHSYTRPKRSYVKILGKKTFTFQPRETIDSDTRGQLVVLKWFNRINEMLNYNTTGRVITDDASIGARTLPVTNDQGDSVSPMCDSKDKIFLRVKAYAPIFATGFDANVHPSFELNVRMCHSTLA